MDFDQLNGLQREILRSAIVSAFVDAPTLDMFLQGKLNKPALDNFTSGSNYVQTVFQVVKVAQAEGWTSDLIGEVQAERPNNRLVRNLPDALRLAEQPGAPRTPAMSLEKIVRGGGFKDLRLWAEKMTAIGQAVCRIEFPASGGTGYGTGLLVADDLVLTNYHVVEAHIAGKLDATQLRCRFDYARDVQGVQDGRLVALAAGADSIIVSSQYDNADLGGPGLPSADHLDFALLRLAEAAGKHDVGGGAKRGTIPVAADPPAPEKNAPVFVVQHPNAEPLSLAIGIVQEAVTPLRLRYDADTLGGSSGSGVFNQSLVLVALHHAGDPKAKTKAEFNQGIPIGLIVGMLKDKQFSPFWK